MGFVLDFAQYFQYFFLYTIICFCIIIVYIDVCKIEGRYKAI